MQRLAWLVVLSLAIFTAACSDKKPAVTEPPADAPDRVLPKDAKGRTAFPPPSTVKVEP